MTGSSLIQVKEVHKSFSNVHAVNGVDLEIEPGEYVALLGPNGAGKTTLVEMIEGIQQPDQGEILVKGMHWPGNEEELHRIIGLSLQETRFIEKLRVKEILDLFASFYYLPKQRVGEILELVNLTEKSSTYSKNLSGGQRQKLALGIALLNEPEILLLDEPTTGLDPTARREIWSILKLLQKERNTAMILTTHYMEEASFLCDRIVIIDQGEVLARGTLDELLAAHLQGEVIEFSCRKPVEIENLPSSHQVLKHELHADGSGGELLVQDIVDFLPQLMKYMEETGNQFISLECRKMTLDDLFISMTGRHLND